MSVAHATLKNYRQSPRKVRLVADAVRGKRVDEAQVILDFAGKRAGGALKTLLQSAVANATDKGHSGDNLIISEIRVDEGTTLFRREARAQGRANVIRKRSSHVYIALDEVSVPEAVEATQTSSS